MAFKAFPVAAERLRSAVRKLSSVVRCSDADSSEDKSGTIAGVSSLLRRSSSIRAGSVLRGLGGVVRANNGPGGAGISILRSGTGSSILPADGGCCGVIGWTSIAVLHGIAGALRAAQPPRKTAAEPSVPNRMRALPRITALWGRVDVSGIGYIDRMLIQIRQRAAARCETSFLSQPRL